MMILTFQILVIAISYQTALVYSLFMPKDVVSIQNYFLVN